MLEVLVWILIATAAIVVVAIFLSMVLIVISGVLGVAGSMAAAAAWTLEKIGRALPEPTEKKDSQS